MYFGASAAGLVSGGDIISVCSTIGDVGDLLLAGDLAAGLVAVGLLIFRSRSVSSLVVVGVGDLTPRLIGGGVAPCSSSDSSEPTVVGDDFVVSFLCCIAALAPGFEAT